VSGDTYLNAWQVTHALARRTCSAYLATNRRLSYGEYHCVSLTICMQLMYRYEIINGFCLQLKSQSGICSSKELDGEDSCIPKRPHPYGHSNKRKGVALFCNDLCNRFIMRPSYRHYVSCLSICLVYGLVTGRQNRRKIKIESGWR